MQKPAQRDQWKSKLGFILAASGSAIGLGNIWRFPYVTGENGGAAFVVVYLACVFFIGLPLLINELALGRSSGKDPVGAFPATVPGTPFIVTGVLCIACCFCVLSYYSVIAGWAIGYALSAITHEKLAFEEFAANPAFVIPLFGVFVFLTILIVQGGIEKGIERWSKVLMPLLFAAILVVILRSVTLKGAAEGIEYYLKPDFSKITGKVVLKALGQAFFSLSVGWGLMITYGSYLGKSDNIVTSSVWIAGMDTLVALMGGFMVFPAVFAFGMNPGEGTALTFKTLPAVFEMMPAGGLFAAFFFMLLTIAALTSSISMLEVPVSYLVDERKNRRRIAAWIVGGLAFLVGIPSTLSQGGNTWLSNLTIAGHSGFLDIMDFFFGTAIIVIIALLCSIYTGWVWKSSRAIKEIEQGCSWFTNPILGRVSIATIWSVFITYLCPVVIALVLLQLMGVNLFEAASP